MISLAWAYLRDRPLSTALNVLLLATSVGMLILLLQLVSQANEQFERDMRGVDLVVGSKGSPIQLILSSVLHIDQPTGNIPFSSLELLRSDPAVSQAVPLALGDNFDGFRIVGTDESFAELYDLKIAEGQEFSEPMQAVIGSRVAETTEAQIGQKFVGTHGLSQDDRAAGHDDAPFEVVGILSPSNTVADRLILTPYQSVWDVHGIDHDHDENHDNDPNHKHGHDHEQAAHQADGDEGADSHDHESSSDLDDDGHLKPMLQARDQELQPEITALLVSYKNASAAIRIPALINRQTELQAAVPATESARLLQLLGIGADGFRILAIGIMATGALAIFVALVSVARSRENDLALLRIMGASRMQVFATVVFEGILTAAAGAIIGWIGAHAFLAILRNLVPTFADLGLMGWSPMLAELLLGLLVVLLGTIAALVPAMRVYRTDPAAILARLG